MCRTKRKYLHYVQQDDSHSDYGNYELVVGCLEKEINTVDQEWTETIQVIDTTVDFQLDTGAMCNVISYKTLQSINKN